jgi:DNA-directed RNA polymerase specialized sigma24 family protein
MANATELDLFTRSMGGDRRARNELFKKYFRDSARVCRLGVGYPDRLEFLHDCFGNLLRTAHSWDKHSSLSHWVESVATWTALQNERQHDISSRGAKGEVRMCAEIEGEDSSHGQVLEAYSPPTLGADDSPAARTLALLGEPEKTVFRKRAMENTTWEEAAEAAGKPLNAVGPAFVRAITRIARFFGAPTPMDEDLLPVFARAAADPGRPEGRAISMRLDAAFYAMAPQSYKLGLATYQDVRTVQLWDTAASSTPPGEELRHHLDECSYCTGLLRALIQMHQALQAKPGVEFHLCPGAFTLANALDMAREAFDQHLAQCPICRQERTSALDGQAPPQVRDSATPRGSVGKKIAWAAAAVVLLAAVSFAGYRYVVSPKNVPVAKAVDPKPEKETPTVSVDPRYRDLVQDVKLEDARIMVSVLPANRPTVKYAIDQFSLGNWSTSLMVSSQLAAKGDDPGAQMLYAMCLYRTRLMTDGYREMLKSEAMSPRESFRCWITFQFALMVGDRNVISREAEHLSSDPGYKEKVRTVMQKVLERS